MIDLHRHLSSAMLMSACIALVACGSGQPSVNTQATVDAQVKATLGVMNSTLESQPYKATVHPQVQATKAIPEISEANTPVPLASITPLPPSPTNTPLPPTPTPFSGPISFLDPSDSEKLNSVLGWQPGGSSASSYDLKSVKGNLTIVAGPGTEALGSTFTAPAVILPMKGNFEVQIRVDAELKPQCCLLAGLGIRSVNEHSRWMRLALTFDGNPQKITMAENNSGGAMYYKSEPYAGSVVSLKMNRQGSVFNFFYSVDGRNWVLLEKDHVTDISDDADIFIYTYSNNGQGVVSHFSNFMVVQK